MALTPNQRQRVAWLIDGYLDVNVDTDDPKFWERWDRQFAAISSPEELFLYASEEHPAMEAHEWRKILDHPLCDQGTALLVFWRNSPAYYYGDEPTDGWSRDRERYELVREIAERCKRGGYPSAVVQFDPGRFKGFSFLQGQTVEQLRVPAHMCVASPGEPVPPLATPDYEWGEDFEG